MHQGQATADHLETVVLNYIDRLDGVAHLVVTGTCQDPASGAIHVVARSPVDPPAYYLRSFSDNAWTGWTEIPLGIKPLHAIPAVYRGRVCLFWLDVKLANEPQQQVPKVPALGEVPKDPQKQDPSVTPEVERYVILGLHFSMFRDGNWAPEQVSQGKLFDKPPLDPKSVKDSRSVEALYTLKARAWSGTISGNVDAVQTSITISTDLDMPAPPFHVSIGSEILLVTVVDGPTKTWTVVRGQQVRLPRSRQRLRQ